jgi:hypothetical protein
MAPRDGFTWNQGSTCVFFFRGVKLENVTKKTMPAEVRERSAIAKKAAAARWTKKRNGGPT